MRGILAEPEGVDFVGWFNDDCHIFWNCSNPPLVFVVFFGLGGFLVCLETNGPHMIVDDVFDTGEVADFMPDSPHTWSDGSRFQDPISGKEVAGTGVFSKSWCLAWDTRV